MKVIFLKAKLWPVGIAFITGETVGAYTPVFLGMSLGPRFIVRITGVNGLENLYSWQRHKYAIGQLVTIDIDEVWSTE